MINYTYKILKFKPQQSALQVLYTRTDYPDIIKNFIVNCTGQTSVTIQAYITDFIKDRVPIRDWNLYDASNPFNENDVSIGVVESDIYTPPPEPPTPTDPTTEELLKQQIEGIMSVADSDWWNGITHTGAGGTVYKVPLTPTIVADMYDHKNNIDNATVTDGGVWRVFKLEASGELVGDSLTFTIPQFQTLIGYVKTHRTKNKLAESNAIALARAGDTSADYNVEYAKL